MPRCFGRLTISSRNWWQAVNTHQPSEIRNKFCFPASIRVQTITRISIRSTPYVRESHSPYSRFHGPVANLELRTGDCLGLGVRSTSYYSVLITMWCVVHLVRLSLVPCALCLVPCALHQSYAMPRQPTLATPMLDFHSACLPCWAHPPMLHFGPATGLAGMEAVTGVCWVPSHFSSLAESRPLRSLMMGSSQSRQYSIATRGTVAIAMDSPGCPDAPGPQLPIAHHHPCIARLFAPCQACPVSLSQFCQCLSFGSFASLAAQ